MKLENVAITITLTLLVLNITGETSLSLWAVFAPLWIPLALVSALGIIIVFITSVNGYTKAKSGGEENG